MKRLLRESERDVWVLSVDSLAEGGNSGESQEVLI
jgi:hypothetical protein